jgi:dihydrofolate reductase
MKTQYYAASSLDGFIATAHHSLDWLLQLGDAEDTSYPEFIRKVGALAMGARTYEWLLEHQVRPDSPEPGPWPYERPSWVFSSRALPPVPGADIRFVRGDVGPVHRDMRAAAGGRNLWIVGGGDLAGQFHDAGLLDEIIVHIASVTLVGGVPFLPRSIVSPHLRLTSVEAFGDAFAELRFDVVR